MYMYLADCRFSILNQVTIKKYLNNSYLLKNVDTNKIETGDDKNI